jgi:long-subunit acyl-CoA synthetase (AMP-forming)
MASGVDGTLGRSFWGRVEKNSAFPAQMIKRKGQWGTLTWAQVGEIVHRLALGLLALDRQRGEAVALLAKSRAEWIHGSPPLAGTCPDRR